jgi:hypothetical protein
VNSYEVTRTSTIGIERIDTVEADGFELTPLGYVFYTSAEGEDGKPTATAVAAYNHAQVVSVRKVGSPECATGYSVEGSRINTFPIERIQ